MNSHAWMVFLGHEKPIPDKRRKLSPAIEMQQKLRSERKTAYQVNTLVSKRARRSIRACLNAGMISNAEMFRLLTSRGMLNKANGGTLSRSIFNQYAKDIRETMGLVRKDKKVLICELFEAGHSLNEIRIYLNTKSDYVYQTLKDCGYKVKSCERYN